ncbi:hypothetical protein B0H13DRAFT_1874212 [Mycena leptocephala]|nr:hypothetical protein B0H13DRAFT_1874212 [Mycena leptocephala]
MQALPRRDLTAGGPHDSMGGFLGQKYAEIPGPGERGLHPSWGMRGQRTQNGHYIAGLILEVVVLTSDPEQPLCTPGELDVKTFARVHLSGIPKVTLEYALKIPLFASNGNTILSSYWIISFKSTGGVRRDPFDLFDISTGPPTERDEDKISKFSGNDAIPLAESPSTS